jgi:predicted DNA-binding transcriptional regulator YafY
MATNKHAIIRYNTLDKCFRNTGRRYSIDDLLEAVNNALANNNETIVGIQLRQLREDIKFMRSEAGYNAPIITSKDGKKGYYHYEDSSFSITQSPLTSTEAEQLQTAITVLQRFEGAPGFEWINEFSSVLKDQFGAKSHARVVAFESNIDYKGYQYITPIFNAIVNKRVLIVDYKPYERDAFRFHFHPSYLKQYNNRWFAFGLYEEKGIETMNIALDRIIETKETAKKYFEVTIDWEDFFSDMIGPSKPDAPPTEVLLWFSKEQAPYVITKPIHQSQKPAVAQDDGSILIKIKVIPNFELESVLLSFGEGVTVLEPESLRNAITKRLKAAFENYY